MQHFCTYFDSNYLTRGLALYESLRRHCSAQFVLWILCFDDFTYDTLLRLDLEGVRLISTDDFERDDPDMRAAKPTRTLVEYYWTATPSLPLHILERDKSVDVITYLDADLFFYSDPQRIFDEAANGSILITEHRYADAYKGHMAISGRFNVSLLSFRRDANGIACLSWWRQRCLEWCFARCEDGKFGDQLYLDEWPDRFEGVVVLQHKGAGLAPWNFVRYRFAWGTEGATVDDSPLVFYHFHGCRQICRHVWKPMDARYCADFTPMAVAHLYIPYFQCLASWGKRLRVLKKDRPGMTHWQVIQGILRQQLVLAAGVPAGVLAWRLGGAARHRATEATRYIRDALCALHRGDLKAARRWYLSAARENPFILLNPHVLSVLVRSCLHAGAGYQGML